jgi:hypothetical protein
MMSAKFHDERRPVAAKDFVKLGLLVAAKKTLKMK